MSIWNEHFSTITKTYNPLGDEPLVSAIVPAFNAAETLFDTLNSIVNQTYFNIEVIIVDDGSRDETTTIAQEFVKRDARVRLFQKSNGGVAAARNLGIDVSIGELIAPIDADDLWHPTRIEKHVKAILAHPEIALVYSPFRSIDEIGIITESSPQYKVRGNVLLRHMAKNFVGNGSGILVRKSALTESGGYSTALREQGLEGCEDYLLQLHIAARHRFEVVPEYLIGYRRGTTTMSSNHVRMIRSRLHVIESIGSSYANETITKIAKMPIRRLLIANDRQSLDCRACIQTIARMAAWEPMLTLYLLLAAVRQSLWKISGLMSFRRRQNPKTPFLEADPQSLPERVPLAIQLALTLLWAFESCFLTERTLR